MMVLGSWVQYILGGFKGRSLLSCSCIDCPMFPILVSSLPYLQDKTCILWDMTKFSFVKQLFDHSGPVTMVTINELNVSEAKNSQKKFETTH